VVLAFNGLAEALRDLLKSSAAEPLNAALPPRNPRMVLSTSRGG
jgi:hypothetical protein